ncbi:class I SAM-dependent methyltransferase [Ideonella sp. A 288]|uniref:class I SAM-dependent methyltransferase n=1 Tax=Ideonella sp. A 288 TaxID=1962181 RepID=UPI000B4AF3C5|nr:class I SAM-dependent methyltransferase [Ideonella sp. A 288]
MRALERQRSATTRVEWRALTKTSPIIKGWRFFLSLDPFTRWGLVKPRGYAGDATLLDFAYGHPSVQSHVEAAGPLGRLIYAETFAAQSSHSARDRIALLRDEVAVMAQQGSFSAMSLAAGHARELEGLPADIASRLSSFVALDIDPMSLQTAADSAGPVPFTPVRRNVVKDALDDLLPADLVYSLGLFDYLTDEIADTVLHKMLSITRPGGKCIVANLAHDAANLGYCEAIMDWWMITRSADDMLAMGQRAAAQGPRAFVPSVKQHGCFHYLELADSDH